MATLSRNIYERRVILIGKTGNGKSSTGNTLLGYQAFKHRRSLKAVTEDCLKGEAFNYDFKLKYTIIDTPGLLDADTELAKRALEIQSSLEICPQPHAFLLVFNSATRLTEDDNITIDLMRVIFGEGVFNHCIIVFTQGDNFESESAFKEYWTSSGLFVKLAERCGNRVTSIENRKDFDEYQKIASADHILALIEDLCENGKKTYSYDWISSHKKALEEHMKTHDGKGNFNDELNALSSRLGTMLTKDLWTVALIGGVAVGASAFGVGAIGYGAYMAGSALFGSATAVVAEAAPAFGATAVKGALSVGGAVVGAAWKLASNFRPKLAAKLKKS